jgi:secreted protein with Ig-like and vWFA domain
MKGLKLRLAKEAAIAAAEVLHEDDRIGVIAFNDRPLEVLPMTRAGDRADVVDRISRITAAGGTDFVPALELARDVMESENLSIEHVVLVSDGESKPGRFRPRVDALRAVGATVTTVGIGYEADANTLTDIAVAGGSKYLRADNEREIPQLLVVEAERVVASSASSACSLRRRPAKPRLRNAPRRPFLPSRSRRIRRRPPSRPRLRPVWRCAPTRPPRICAASNGR